jgi:hypothetical protein
MKMEELTLYLNQIVDWHTKLGSPLRYYLRPGLSKDEISKKVSVLPFSLSDEFFELYAWKDGTPIRDRWVSFIENHRFLPLDEALHHFEITYPVAKEFYEDPDWIMTFEDGSGDGYAFSAANEHSTAAPMVFHFEGEGVNMVFQNLTQMMMTMVECFQIGIFTIADDGGLDTDFFKLGEIAHKLNPEIPYWEQYTSYSRSSFK